MAGLVVAAVLGGAGPILLPSGAPAASASEDNRLAEMASPSPTRGLVYTGLALGKDGTACEGVFEAKSRTGGGSVRRRRGPRRRRGRPSPALRTSCEPSTPFLELERRLVRRP
jgi:hypothetical protein